MHILQRPCCWPPFPLMSLKTLPALYPLSRDSKHPATLGKRHKKKEGRENRDCVIFPRLHLVENCWQGANVRSSKESRSPAGHCRGLPEHSCASPCNGTSHFSPLKKIPEVFAYIIYYVKFIKMTCHPTSVTCFENFKTLMDIHSHKYKDNNQRDLIYLHRELSLPLRRNVPSCRKVVCPVHCSRGVW